MLAMGSLLLSVVWRGFALPATTPDGFIMHFYQQVIGELDGRSCPSYPVCSLYAQQALQQYGLLMGSWLAVDRLIHEGDDLHDGVWLVYDGVERLSDPLSRNTVWLQKLFSQSADQFDKK
ncbi:MAG: membrane protein insertion efficiency factor YidD [Mariprofundus sp.]|nr:membrane protein insertion efficiency factor YidD [Mariprofundus sp.]